MDVRHIFRRLLILIICLSIIGYVVSSCLKFQRSKEDIIYLVKNNIEELTQLINEIDANNINRDFSIEKNRDIVYGQDNEIKYNRTLKNYIFDKFNLIYIYFDSEHELISFNISGIWTDNYKLFYYSENDSDLYNWDKTEKNAANSGYVDVKGDNWRVCLFARHGIYTEKIIDNWYYCEDCYGLFTPINYIDDGLKAMGRFDEVMSRIQNGSYKKKDN